MPNRVYDHLTSLAACLAQQIEDDGLPSVCWSGVIPGDGVVADYAGDCADACGMAWVRLTQMYPSQAVGVVDTTVGNCSASLGLDIEVGILRCMMVMEDGGPPPDSELAATADLQHGDAMAIWRAINCCTALPNKDFILGPYLPMGPQGGMVGGAYTLSTAL